MSNEWTELKIDNLPSDIFITERYEFKVRGDNFIYYLDNVGTKQGILEILLGQRHKHPGLLYRKPEPKAPTHEEITSKWFLTDSGSWQKVTAYRPSDPRYGHMNTAYHLLGAWVSVDWFSDKESAVIPPESK